LREVVPDPFVGGVPDGFGASGQRADIRKHTQARDDDGIGAEGGGTVTEPADGVDVDAPVVAKLLLPFRE